MQKLNRFAGRGPRRALAFCALFLVAFTATQAAADCTASGSTTVLTPKTTAEIQSAAQDFTIGTGYSCEGAILTLLSGDFIRATFMASANAGSLVDGVSSASIGYTLYADSGHTMPITAGQQVNFSTFTLIGLFSGPDGDIPVHVSTATPTVPAGVYTDVIPVRWQWNVCRGIEAAGICVGTIDSGDEVVNMTISLTLEPSCSIASQDVYDFGQASFVEDIAAIPVPFQVTCSLDQTFQYYFDAGANFTSGWRRMVKGTDTIDYGIFLQDGTTPVGPTIADAIAALGTGGAQNFNLTASINPAQSPVPPGIYQDQVLIVVEF